MDLSVLFVLQSHPGPPTVLDAE